MKRTIITGVCVATLVALSGVSGVSADEQLAKKDGCFACHSVNKKIVGPAYKDVAAKYRGDAGAEAKLIAKVKSGGKGVWGAAAMPANSPRISDADIQTLVKWILSL